MKYYKDDGQTNIHQHKPEEITLESAIQEVDILPHTYDGNFIGFTKGKEETIQFVRREQENWLIDVPVFENGKYASSLNDTELTTEKVKEIIKKFFLGEDWQSLCNLRQL